MGPATYIPITLHFSDGVDTGYPTQTEKLIADDGTYEYFRRVAKNETKDLMWRTKTAKHLIEKYMGEDEAKGEIACSARSGVRHCLHHTCVVGLHFVCIGLTDTGIEKNYIFKTLPDKYQLYEHVKAKKVCSSGFCAVSLCFPLSFCG